ncbi:hypothetical protein [Lignipirellula cremea]|uniref:Uncharacterized protein n=1 Tax=Lignipirellula cremea TaxID=2528010 RepID=A0A518DS72_9BACT|nr:hypothetical protein [Lignipirellula cremea]QDU94685.1 hypothetical protein Pla8534_24910 [Lignipirellula cremea]
MSVDDMIRDHTKESDIAYGSNLYQEVARRMTDVGLNLAFFAFTTSERSSCARTLDDDTASCPVLTLYLRYNAYFQQTGIDPHHGNWDDKWAQTRTVRDALNVILQRHGLDNDYVSDHTFIFVRTLEELAFRQLGQKCADGIKQLVIAEAPGVHVDGVYWDGAEYYVLMPDKADYKRVKRNVKANITKTAPKLLANADTDGYCQDYKTTIEFGYGGVVPMQFLRG